MTSAMANKVWQGIGPLARMKEEDPEYRGGKHFVFQEKGFFTNEAVQARANDHGRFL